MNGIPKELLLSVGGALLCAFAVSFLMCPLVKSFAYKIGAIDVPKDNRRMHKKPVPRLGGLAIFLGFIVSMLLFVKVDHQLQGILLGASIIVVLGVVDDMSPLRAYFKFCVQIFAALVAVFHGVVIQTLSNPNVFAESPYWDLGWLSIPVTIIWIVAITNAVNLIDGIDGLASGLSMVALSVFGTLAVIDGRWMSALLAFATVGVLLPFFFYNVFGNADRGRKIFMGDTGSLTLGYILSFLAVQYTMNTYEAGINYEGAMLIAFSVLLVPCLDVVRVVLGRVRRGRDPFMPDKTHIHHKFLAMGFTPRRAMISILCISLLLCLANMALVSYLDNTLLLLCDVVVWTVMNLYMDKVILRHNKSKI